MAKKRINPPEVPNPPRRTLRGSINPEPKYFWPDGGTYVPGGSVEQANAGAKEFHEAIKHDAGKIRLELLPIGPLEEVAKVMTLGANKYADHNWRKGFLWSRLIGAALRHIFAFARGEDLDAEWGTSHLAHAAFCILALEEHRQDRLGTDDRWKKTISVNDLTMADLHRMMEDK